MRTIISLWVLIVLSISSYCQPSIAGDFTISGIVNVPFTGKVYLQYYDYTLFKSVLDSCKVTNQRYTFNGILREPVTANLYFTPSDTSNNMRMNSVYFLLIEPGTIKVETSKFMSDLKVVGSTTFNEYIEFQQKDRMYLQRVDSCRFHIAQLTKLNDTSRLQSIGLQ